MPAVRWSGERYADPAAADRTAMHMTVTLTILAVAAVLAAAWWLRVRSRRRRRGADRASDRTGDAPTRTLGGGPVSDARRRTFRGRDGVPAPTAFDPDGLPLSRDFLPEQGDLPPVERDLFAELARRRMRDGDA